MARRFSRDDMTTLASSVSFWLIISAVPFLMLIISIISHVPGLGREDVTDMLYSALPDMMLLHELVDSILSNIYVSNPGTVISLSAVLTLWSASSGIFRLEKAIKQMNGTGIRQGYVKLRMEALLYTVLFMLAIVISLLLLVLGSWIGDILIREFPVISGTVMMFLNFRTLMTMALIFVFMVLMYRFIPGRQEEARPVLPGAAFSSAAWILTSFAFSIYFTYFKNISYMYGSLGAIILLMFWLFAIICIILAGAEINITLYELNIRSPKALLELLK